MFYLEPFLLKMWLSQEMSVQHHCDPVDRLLRFDLQQTIMRNENTNLVNCLSESRENVTETGENILNFPYRREWRYELNNAILQETY